MGQRRYTYESDFQDFLRRACVPHVSVNEAQRTPFGIPAARPGSLKSFDFVVYGEGVNLLVDVKGRKGPRVARRGAHAITGGGGGGGRGGRGGWGNRLESWSTREDVTHLLEWENLFGPGFLAVFVFAYAFEQVPADGQFAEVYRGKDRWYALRTVGVRDYAATMRERSPRWGTVELPDAAFERVWRPLVAGQGAFRHGAGGALLRGRPAVA